MFIWFGMDISLLSPVQLHAAHIITGLPFFASLNSVYFETGWEKLDGGKIKSKVYI